MEKEKGVFWIPINYESEECRGRGIYLRVGILFDVLAQRAGVIRGRALMQENMVLEKF